MEVENRKDRERDEENPEEYLLCEMVEFSVDKKYNVGCEPG